MNSGNHFPLLFIPVTPMPPWLEITEQVENRMAEEEINYTKEVLASNPNLAFVGVMFFLMLVVNFWGFLPLLLAGEIGALFVAQHPRVQRIIRARKNKDRRIEAEEAETSIENRCPAITRTII